MREIINSILALLIGVVFLSMGNTLLNIILPLKMEAAGYSTASYGFLGSVFFAGLLSGALSAKRFIQGVGHIRAFAAFATVFSAVVILHPLFTAYSFWILLRFIGGFCIAGLFAAIEAWLNQQSSAENRGKVLAIYFMSNYMAMIMARLHFQWLIRIYSCMWNFPPVCLFAGWSFHWDFPVVYHYRRKFLSVCQSVCPSVRLSVCLYV